MDTHSPPSNVIEFDASSLPTTITVQGFDALYTEHLLSQESNKKSSGVMLPILLSLPGYIIIVLGILILLFGPEQIRYSIYHGPSFFQWMQMRPGMVVTIGFACVAGAQLLAKSINATDIKTDAAEFFLANYQLRPQNLNEFSEHKQNFEIAYKGSDQFEIVAT